MFSAIWISTFYSGIPIRISIDEHTTPTATPMITASSREIATAPTNAASVADPIPPLIIAGKAYPNPAPKKAACYST